MGKSPIVLQGWPMSLGWVGSDGEIRNMERVLRPELTVKRYCSGLVRL